MKVIKWKQIFDPGDLLKLKENNLPKKFNYLPKELYVEYICYPEFDIEENHIRYSCYSLKDGEEFYLLPTLQRFYEKTITTARTDDTGIGDLIVLTNTSNGEQKPGLIVATEPASVRSTKRVRIHWLSNHMPPYEQYWSEYSILERNDKKLYQFQIIK